MEDKQLTAPLTASELEKILNKVLTTKGDPKHEAEHAFVREMIVRRKRSTERWEKFRRSLLGAIAVAVVGWIITALTFLGSTILEHWKP